VQTGSAVSAPGKSIIRDPNAVYCFGGKDTRNASGIVENPDRLARSARGKRLDLTCRQKTWAESGVKVDQIAPSGMLSS
jgi:hypothetical protein